MKAVTLIPYASANPFKDFAYTGKAIEGEAYKKMLDGEYSKYMNIIDGMIDDMSAHRPSFNPYIQKLNNKYKQVNIAFFKCDVHLANRDKSDITIDELIQHWQDDKPFLLIMDMVIDNKTDPDMLVDLNMWSSDSAKILDPKYDLTDEERIAALPKKDFKLHFPQYNSNAYLADCKLLDKFGKYIFVALVDRILFVKQ